MSILRILKVVTNLFTRVNAIWSIYRAIPSWNIYF